jgi:heme A synthase
VLVVVLVSAAIRLNASGVGEMFSASGIAVLRGVHRTAASLEVLAALWVAWVAWRRGAPSRQASAVVLALTVFLAALGIIAGKNPLPAQALGNVLGGLALAAAFAWLLGEKGSGPFFGKWGLTLFVLLALQAVIGARVSIFSRTAVPALPLHALLGLGIAALAAWLALARIRGRMGRLLFALALLAPVAGFTALQYEYSAAAALVHAASGAFLVVAAVAALSRNA